MIGVTKRQCKTKLSAACYQGGLPAGEEMLLSDLKLEIV